jgi:hypothetical protein
MHVVQVRHAQNGREQHANRAAFLVRMDGVIPAADGAPGGRERQRDVQRHLGPGRPDLHAADERWADTAEDAQPRHLDVAAERIGHQIDGVPQRGQRADAVELRERRAPGLEERLGRDHEDAHAWRARSRGRVHEVYMLHYGA